MKTAIIIGGGASGVAAALTLRALQPDADIVILEKNERILKKLLTTGNGRCNITNTAVSPACYPAFAETVITQYDFERVRAFLLSLSLPIKADNTGRCYPLSESANNAVNLLLEALSRANICIQTSAQVTAIERRNNRYILQADKSYTADAVIFAPGSAAAVRGYNGTDLLADLHINLTPPTPALCPIPSTEPFLKSLKGVRVKGSITLGDKTEHGEIQFNESNISGICAFNLAKYAYDGCCITLDFCDGLMDEQTLIETIADRARSVQENAAVLDFLLLRKLALTVLKRAGIKPSGNPKELTDAQIHAIADKIRHFTLTANKPHDFAHAQTVCGGLSARDIDPATLESRQNKGVFMCGEILDADAPCGGFNLHWAWASGMCAAQAASRFISASK